MKPVSYQGYMLTPSSYQNIDMPGYWFPRVVVSGGNLDDPKNVVLPPARGLDENMANEQAMESAIDCIQRNDL